MKNQIFDKIGTKLFGIRRLLICKMFCEYFPLLVTNGGSREASFHQGIIIVDLKHFKKH